MRVADVLDDEILAVRLRTPDDVGVRDRLINGCAQSELMDPTPFLMRGELMLTTGMGLQFHDPRTWDAYAERLARVPISALAFGIGRVHPAVPDGLIAACEHHGIPVLEVPADLPLLQFARHVWQEIAGQRYEVLRRGWELADECTRLATGGQGVGRVLEQIAAVVEADVTLVDPDGFTLETTRSGPPGPGPKTRLSLPGGSGARFGIRIDGGVEGQLLQPLLGPVAAVLAMQLSYTLASPSPLHPPVVARFLEALTDSRNVTVDDLRPLAVGAGFDPGQEWAAVVLTAPEQPSNAGGRVVSWRLRVRLESRFRSVRFVEEGDRTTLLLQGSVDGAPTSESLRSCLGESLDGTGTFAQYTTGLGLEELPLVLRLARRRPVGIGVTPMPVLDLAAVAAALPSAGLSNLARRLLEPLTTADTGGILVDTLSAHLRHSGATRAVCDELFIHRNTLAYRMRRIESVLGVDLDSGETRATLLLALHILGR